ncbi:YbaB/EbfC family nucleoid-associated protein [Saccharomonospora sp. NPDC046836]|uniref:YbaB/EbfC family nucleoid-associated protein n=1 Tax=Saccharomonospora sp. NPDC046836 TaxID=3156921 RepID=UPI0033CF2DBF
MAGNAASATVTSRDGLVRATVDSSGTLTGLEFAPTAFERSDPESLAQTVLEVVQQGRTRVQHERDALKPPPVPPRPTRKRIRHTRQV